MEAETKELLFKGLFLTLAVIIIGIIAYVAYNRGIVTDRLLARGIIVDVEYNPKMNSVVLCGSDKSPCVKVVWENKVTLCTGYLYSDTFIKGEYYELIEENCGNWEYPRLRLIRVVGYDKKMEKK